MKYIVITEKGNDIFDKEFDNYQKAIDEAREDWKRMSKADQKNTKAFYVLESVNPDEEAEDHFDGDIVLNVKYECWYAITNDNEDYGTGSFDKAEAVKMCQESNLAKENDEPEYHIVRIGGYGLYGEAPTNPVAEAILDEYGYEI